MIEIFTYYFVKKLVSITCVFEIQTAYRSCLDNDDETNFWKNNYNTSDNLTNMFKKLCLKYCNFFNIQKADQLISYQITDSAIKFKSDTESLYMCIYNMFSTELKTLKNYINNFLIKKWICEFQNLTDMFILFIFKKSSKLCFYIDYCKLNIIIIKNYYSLLLINKLLN